MVLPKTAAGQILPVMHLQQNFYNFPLHFTLNFIKKFHGFNNTNHLSWFYFISDVYKYRFIRS